MALHVFEWQQGDMWGVSMLSGELLLTAALLFHWCANETDCSFFFHQSSKASFMVGVCVCVSRHVCVDTFMNVRVRVSVGAYGFADVSRGQNDTSTEIQTQQLCGAQKRITLLQVLFQGVGLGGSTSVCLCMHVYVCVQVEVFHCVDICKRQLYPS